MTKPKSELFPKPSFLERAEAYQAAVAAGELPNQVAAKARVHDRTVLRYLRLAKMPELAKYLAQQHPELFTTTWASRLARRGPLPKDAVLITEMQQMVMARRVWFPSNTSERTRRPARPAPKSKKRTVAQWKALLGRVEARDLSHFVYTFLVSLKEEGYIADEVWHSLVSAVWAKQ